MVRSVAALVACLVVCGCGRETVDGRDAGNPDADAGADLGAPDLADTASDDVATDADDEPDVRFVPECVTTPTPWAPGTPVFADRTDRAGLAAMTAEGSHIGAVDWNGDGLPDLALRRDNTTGLTWDDWAAGERSFWLLENQGDGTFADRTQQSGITRARSSADEGRPAELTVFGDVDNDGDLDAFTGFRSDGSLPEGAELMLNDGTGNFALGDTTHAFRRVGQTWPAYGASFVDHDRDGNLDLWVVYFVGAGFPRSDALYVQEDGIFADRSSLFGITDQATVAALNEGRGPTAGWGATVCDVNDDGRPDLLASSYGRLPNHLWLGSEQDGGPWYENVSVESGYAFDHRVDWSDDESARCWCSLHPTDEDCAGVPAPAVIPCAQDSDAFRWDHATSREPYQLGGHTGTTICADFDADGDLDLLNTELRHWDVGQSSDPTEILVNDGGARPVFARPGRGTMGLVRAHSTALWDEGDLDAAVFDFDNDGRPDVWLNSSDYPDTQAHLYRQVAPLQFEEVAFADGIELTRASGIAVADFDRDGDLDVVAGRSSMRCEDEPECTGFHARYYENLVGNTNNWLQLDLEGAAGTNRSAIGARVTVETADGAQVQEVGGGYGRLGLQHDLVLHFGLGVACEATVTVRWPNAELTTETVTLAAGARWRWQQGEAPRALLPP